MNRINVTFYDETYEKLEDRKKSKGSKSIADCIRELVELGLKVEEAANKNNAEEQGDGVLKTLMEVQKQLKNTLIWSLETRLLTRYMVEHMPEGNKEQQLAVLEKYKESANNHVKGLLDEPAN
jgi:predicted CopG family antitoxin